MKYSILSVFAALAAAVSAATPPDYTQDPTGNPIYSPGLEEQVPAGEPYQIVWGPTTPGKVSITLLRGPSNNVQPIDVIADSIENSGSYTWTPSTDLEGDVIGYGLLIVVEGTGQYQYSTQFGIKNDKVVEPSKTSSGSSSPTGKPSASATSSADEEEPTKTGTSSYPGKTLTSSYVQPTATGTAPTTPPTTYSSPSPTASSVTPPPASPDAAGRTSISIAAGALAALAAVFVF